MLCATVPEWNCVVWVMQEFSQDDHNCSLQPLDVFKKLKNKKNKETAETAICREGRIVSKFWSFVLFSSSAFLDWDYNFFDRADMTWAINHNECSFPKKPHSVPIIFKVNFRKMRLKQQVAWTWMWNKNFYLHILIHNSSLNNHWKWP